MLNKVLGKAFLSGFQDLADVRVQRCEDLADLERAARALAGFTAASRPALVVLDSVALARRAAALTERQHALMRLAEVLKAVAWRAQAPVVVTNQVW